MTKAQTIRSMALDAIGQAQNNHPGQEFAKALRPLIKRMDSLIEVGQDPDETLAGEVLQIVRLAEARYNEAKALNLPTNDEVLARIAAAANATPVPLIPEPEPPADA